MRDKSKTKRQMSFLPAALLLVFTFFVFGPSDLYFGNAQELWFSISDIVPVIVIAGIALFVVLNGIYFVMPPQSCGFFTAFVWGLGIALYMQGNFLQIRYGVLDGKEIDWKAYTGYGVVNTIVWGLCLVAPLILCAVNKSLLKKIISFSSFVIIAVQVVTLVFLGMTTKVERRNIAVTREGIYTLSEKKNIVVFILDTFDAEYMNELLAREGEFIRQFDGFTYYDNTVGMYPTTKGALPHLLTGIKYLNETTYNEYLDNAFQKTNFYNILKKNDYVSGIYTYSSFLPNIQIPDVIKNVNERTHITIKNHVGFSTKLYQLTATKYFPHVLKRMIWMYSEEFDKHKNVVTMEAPLYSIDDIYFNQKLLEDGISFMVDKNVFRFYHLKGAHPPYIYRRSVLLNKNMEYVPNDGKGNAYEQAKGALQIVLNYITLLKEDGVYDNTLMLIMADHGNGGELGQDPLLMVKDWNSTSDFSVSSVPISYDNIMPMLEGRLNDNIPCNDFLKEASTRNDERYFYHYKWNNREDRSYLPNIIEYIFFNGRNDILHAKLTDKIFEDRQVIRKYTFGDTIVFGQTGNTGEYIVGDGFPLPESWGNWSNGKAAIMSLSLAALPKGDITVNIKGRLLTGNILDHQTVKISANGQFIEEKRLTSGDWSFVVPQELVRSRELNLSFEYPDAASPFELGLSNDRRVLAVGYTTMTLSEFAGIDFGSAIGFGKDGNAEEYLVEGFSGGEPWGRWSNGKTGIMSLPLAALPKGDITVNIEGRLFTGNILDHQTVRISANGQFLEEKRLTSGDWSFVVPQGMVTGRMLELSFEYPDAVSPFDLGLSGDGRLLAVGWTTMTLTENKRR